MLYIVHSVILTVGVCRVRRQAIYRYICRNIRRDRLRGREEEFRDRLWGIDCHIVI